MFFFFWVFIDLIFDNWKLNYVSGNLVIGMILEMRKKLTISLRKSLM